MSEYERAYVERVLAKVNMTLKDGRSMVDDERAGEGTELTVSLETVTGVLNLLDETASILAAILERTANSGN